MAPSSPVNSPSLPSRFFEPENAVKRFGPRALRYGEYLTKIDPPADAAIAALAGIDAGQASRWIDVGGRKGAAAIAEAPRALRDFFELAEVIPAWMDEAALDRGGEVLFRMGPVGGLTLGLKSLV
ncbi:MAG: hypothetical protein ABI461_17695, partial [Polyangiaceae bacterium]